MKTIIKYLKENVIGKSLTTEELIYKLNNDKSEGVYSDRIIFSNLCENQWGFNFDMFIISNEQIYKLNEMNERVKLSTDFSGVSVFRFELAKRHSSNQITGIFRLVTTSAQNQTAQGIACAIFDLKLVGNKLSWQEEQCLYRDQPIGDNLYAAVAFNSESSFYFEDGKLVFDYQGTCLDVDVTTYLKKPSKSVYPAFVAKES